jgi:hypothetical protein
LKTGGLGQVDATIHTIDPNFWYINVLPGDNEKVDEQAAMASELENWNSDKFRIYSLLVVTSAAAPPAAVETCKSYRTKAKRLERCLRVYEKAENSDQEPLSEAEKNRLAGELLTRLKDIDYAFCTVDRQQTPILFGEAYMKLIELTKKKVGNRQRNDLSSANPASGKTPAEDTTFENTPSASTAITSMASASTAPRIVASDVVGSASKASAGKAPASK